MNLNKTITALLLAICSCIALPADAAPWGNLGYFGNYSPYGIQSRSLTPTPPYFSLHPPVYYGGRHTRPYGISPFATYPQVSAPKSYHGRLQSDFVTPPHRNHLIQQPTCDACGQSHNSIMSTGHESHRGGNIQANPFADQIREKAIRSDI